MGAMLDAGVIENAAIAQSTSDDGILARARRHRRFPMLLPDLVAFDVSFAIADIGPRARDAALRQAGPQHSAGLRPPDAQPAPDRAGARNRHRQAALADAVEAIRHRARASRLSVGRTRHRRQEARRPRPYPQPGRVGRHAGHQGRAGSSRHPQPRQVCPDAAALALEHRHAEDPGASPAKRFRARGGPEPDAARAHAIIPLPPQYGQSAPFRLDEISNFDERGPAWYWNNISCGEHTGTHLRRADPLDHRQGLPEQHYRNDRRRSWWRRPASSTCRPRRATTLTTCSPSSASSNGKPSTAASRRAAGC